MLNQSNLAKFPVLAVTMLVGCGGGGSQQQPQQQPSIAASEPNQAEICQTRSIGIASGCKAGQKIIFLPEQFGNAQLPVYFAAANCDLRYSVVLTNGAVACIFKPINPVDHAKPPATPGSEAQGK